MTEARARELLGAVAQGVLRAAQELRLRVAVLKSSAVTKLIFLMLHVQFLLQKLQIAAK